MRAGLSVSVIALLCGCRPPTPPALGAPAAPTMIVAVEGRALTVSLPAAAYLTVFGVDELGRITLVSPVSPSGRMSFGPLAGGRQRLRLAQAILWIPREAATLAPLGSPRTVFSDEAQECRTLTSEDGRISQPICSPAGSPAGPAAISAWSLADWALLVVAASPDPLSAGQVRHAVSQARSYAGQAARSALERQRVREDVAERLIAAMQGQVWFAQISPRPGRP